MGSKERRDREKSQTRKLILEAARALFTELGFEAVTMRMIAEKIEYSPTAIYVHFADKESLMRELSALDFRSLSAAVLRAQKVEDPIERIHKLGHAYLARAPQLLPAALHDQAGAGAHQGHRARGVR
jgi:AcrR family transcriptional regulator